MVVVEFVCWLGVWLLRLCQLFCVVVLMVVFRLLFGFMVEVGVGGDEVYLVYIDFVVYCVFVVVGFVGSGCLMMLGIIVV